MVCRLKIVSVVYRYVTSRDRPRDNQLWELIRDYGDIGNFRVANYHDQYFNSPYFNLNITQFPRAVEYGAMLVAIHLFT